MPAYSVLAYGDVRHLHPVVELVADAIGESLQMFGIEANLSMHSWTRIGTLKLAEPLDSRQREVMEQLIAEDLPGSGWRVQLQMLFSAQQVV